MVSKILIVDDDRTSRELVANALHKTDRTFLKAGCGAEAIDLIDGERPDLVVLDLALPKKTGTEVLRHIRALPAMRRVPVMIVSGRESALYQKAMIAEGATAYFTKPLNVEEFQCAVERAMQASRDATRTG